MALLHACKAMPSACTPSSSFFPRAPRHSRGINCQPAVASLSILTCLRTAQAPRARPQSVRFVSTFFKDEALLKLRSTVEESERSSAAPHAPSGGACAATGSISLSGETLRWIFAGAAALLLFLKNTAMNKAVLVPLLALQAPRDAITWIRGEYGMWAACLAILVKLFYHIPGELELPLVFILLVITSPYQVLDFRGTTAALIVSACVAAYVAYQHFSGAGGVKESFREGTFMASLAVILLVAVPIALFFGGF